jgi:hypothetical protein
VAHPASYLVCTGGFSPKHRDRGLYLHSPYIFTVSFLTKRKENFTFTFTERYVEVLTQTS